MHVHACMYMEITEAGFRSRHIESTGRLEKKPRFFRKKFSKNPRFLENFFRFIRFFRF